MNYLKQNPIGKDAIIQNLQYKLYNDLLTKWGSDLDGYGRCYVVSTNGRKTIEPYLSSNEYKNLVVAEKNKFFFTAENDDEKVGNNYYQTKVYLYFIVDVKKLKPDITHRADEEVRNDVLNLIESNVYFNVIKVVTNIDKVFNRYDYDYTDDMQPYHCFKIELQSVEYNINQTYCTN